MDDGCTGIDIGRCFIRSEAAQLTLLVHVEIPAAVIAGRLVLRRNHQENVHARIIPSFRQQDKIWYRPVNPESVGIDDIKRLESRSAEVH